MMENNYNALDAYAQSKLGNILFNLELSKKVKCKSYIPYGTVKYSMLEVYLFRTWLNFKYTSSVLR